MAIHIAVFVGLYVFTYELAMREVVAAYRIGASYVLEEAVEVFTDTRAGHAVPPAKDELSFVAGAHEATTIALLSPAGEVRILVGAREPFDSGAVRKALGGEGQGAIRVRKDGAHLFAAGVRSLRNEGACRDCHAAGPPVLGIVGVQRDLGEWVRGSAGRMRWAVATLSVGWMVLLGASLLIRNRVIGRPLAQIAEAVQAPVRAESPVVSNHDLEGLAGTVHGAIWSLLERQRLRDREVEKGMERATQLAVLGDVAAGLSHEIKNPLAGLRAALSMLRRGEALAPAERIEVVDTMISEVDRVNRTVDTLLSLARPRGLVRTPADLGRLVGKATALLDASARVRGIRLTVAVAQQLPSLDLDSDLVIQLIVNLVTNALDAVEGGGG